MIIKKKLIQYLNNLETSVDIQETYSYFQSRRYGYPKVLNISIIVPFIAEFFAIICILLGRAPKNVLTEYYNSHGIVMLKEIYEKTTVGIFLSKKIIERARFQKLNLSRISEQALISVLDYLEPQNSNQSSDSLDNSSFPKKVEWAGPDLNRRPSARQADVLTELDDRPYSHFRMFFWYLSFSFLQAPKT
jgi:hypothetical protein